jgi:pimeloyl-ACP methyl ester carboxylesterase
MSAYSDQFWQSPDGLRLHYRDYAGPQDQPKDRPVILCLPGLTRNARDFAGLAEKLSQHWRVLCPEMRGRGDSDYAKNAQTYNPMQYVADVNALLEQAGVERFVAIGTSLGGLMTMVLAMIDSKRIAGAVLNDIGPVIEASGLARIRDYVGQARSYPTWMHAARDLEEEQGASFPDYDAHQWLAGRPLLLLRGELSDILSTATLEDMARRIPDAVAVTLPRIGHAPTLDEPEAVAAIERLLERVV